MPRIRDTPRFDEAASDARAGLCETAQHFKYMLTTLRKDWCQPGDYERLQSAVKETYEWLYKNTQTATKDEFKAKEKKLMKVGDRVLDGCGPPQTETDSEIAEFSGPL